MSYQLINRSAHDTGLASESVDCVVTSPPYFALRKYAGEQQVSWPAVKYSPMPGLPFELHIAPMDAALGLGPDIESFIGHLILVMREMWRVLKPHGTAWVNLGDSYVGSGGAHTHDHANPGLSKSANRDGAERYKADGGRGRDKAVNGLRAKNMLGVPWRFAFAAQADGWILRSDVIWAKGLSFLPDYAGSCMPESVTDRPTKGHEYIFLLSKSEKYYFDMDAVKEVAINGDPDSPRGSRGIVDGHMNGGLRKQDETGNRRYTGFNERYFSKPQLESRNLRSVWAINPQPYPKAHYAVFPQRLVEPMIKASTSAYGVCPACGCPWRRVVEREAQEYNHKEGIAQALRNQGATNGGTEKVTLGVTHLVERHTTGWEPTCTCGRDDVTPAVVLDPFNGSGTTGRAALALGRSYIGVDISEQYLTELAPDRLSNIQMELAL